MAGLPLAAAGSSASHAGGPVPTKLLELVFKLSKLTGAAPGCSIDDETAPTS